MPLGAELCPAGPNLAQDLAPQGTAQPPRAIALIPHVVRCPLILSNTSFWNFEKILRNQGVLFTFVKKVCEKMKNFRRGFPKNEKS